MKLDIRAEVARYYDLQQVRWDDVTFYKSHIPRPDARVLELGCGTGRVLVPLSAYCGYIEGIDLSAAMLDICRKKLDAAGIPASRAKISTGDITDFDLGRRFDLIIAPFRVIQNFALHRAWGSIRPIRPIGRIGRDRRTQENMRVLRRSPHLVS